jgi:short-subunit dehydrogenase
VIRSYAGKVAVVTGAAHGLGRALAGELATRKSHLALIDIDPVGLLDCAEKLARDGTVVTSHVADIASQHELERAAGAIEDAHGTIHLLVNNAAVSASASFRSMSPEGFARVVQVNYFGVVHSCRLFLPLLEAHAEGQILNVSSCFAWLGYPRKTAYASSKGAVRAFSESLRGEVARSGVGVTVLYPGPLATALVRDGICDSEQLREREEGFLRTRGLPLREVARRSLDRLLANPSRIVIGLDYHLIDVATRISPRLASLASRMISSRLRF